MKENERITEACAGGHLSSTAHRIGKIKDPDVVPLNNLANNLSDDLSVYTECALVTKEEDNVLTDNTLGLVVLSTVYNASITASTFVSKP